MATNRFTSQPPPLEGVDPDVEQDLDSLYRSLEWSRWRLEPFRQHAFRLRQEFVGPHYSASSAQKHTPLNLVHLHHNITLRQLVSKAPRAMCSSKKQPSKPVAADLQAWMDHAAEAMGLEQTSRMWVSNALFGWGALKVGLAVAGEMDLPDGTRVAIGQPFAETVDLDDWAHDMTAKRYDQAQFAANRYRVRLDEAANNPLFDEKARAQLADMQITAYNERGDLRVTTLSQSTQAYLDEWKPHCELWDIWLAKEKLVITVPYHQGVHGGLSGPPLRVVQWKGPKEGPFLILSFVEVSNNVMPVSPLGINLDMHDAANRAWRKLINQIERQKTWYGYRGSDVQDAERARTVNDGEMVQMNNPQAVMPYTYEGAAQESLIAVEQIKNIYSWLAGNLDLQGGLSPQSQTLGQDELLSKSSSTQVAEMQDRTIAAHRKLYQSLAYWWWKNPLLTYHTSREVEGEDIPVQIDPQMRQMPFEDMDIDIDPYSMQHSTPQSQLSAMMQLLMNLLMPAQPQMQQQGITLKWPDILADIGRLMDKPDIAAWLNIGPPPEMQGPMQMANDAAQEAQRMPSVTTRRNVRINRPSMTNDGQSKVMQLLAAGGAQPKQAMAAMGGRGVG